MNGFQKSLNNRFISVALRQKHSEPLNHAIEILESPHLASQKRSETHLK